jgi:glucokinase
MKSLGIDLGGTKIAVAVVEDGKILESTQVPTPQEGFPAVLEAMVGASKPLLAGHPGISAVGVGSPGPLDFDKGTVLWAPNIVGMAGAPIVAALEDGLQRRVILENDANAAGYAEHRYGAARGLDSSIYLTISTGIGGGLFLGDRVVRGAHGLAGEVGHMIVLPGGPIGGDGHLGTLEGIAAGRSIAREGTHAYGQAMTTREVFERARAGERIALAIIDNAAEFTGIGISNLVKVFDPAAFVIGGGLTFAGDFYLERIWTATGKYLETYPRPQIRMAQLGADAGVIGAAAVAAHTLQRETA